MSVDKIFDLTAGVYFYFYNIHCYMCLLFPSQPISTYSLVILLALSSAALLSHPLSRAHCSSPNERLRESYLIPIFADLAV